MGIDEILILVIAGVFALLILRSELRGRRLSLRNAQGQIFTPQNWFGRSLPGGWTELAEPEVAIWLFGAAIVIFSWTLVNVPEMFALSVIYLFMLLVYAFVWIGRTIRPKSKWGAVLSPGKFWKGLVYGVIVGAVWAGVVYPFSMQQEVVPVLALSLLAVWAIWGLAIPIAEEAVFRGALLPTMVEDIGIVPSLLGTSALFAAFHWQVAQALAILENVPPIYLLGSAFGFSILAGILALRMRSVAPAVGLHIAYNTVLILISAVGAGAAAVG